MALAELGRWANPAAQEIARAVSLYARFPKPQKIVAHGGVLQEEAALQFTVVCDGQRFVFKLDELVAADGADAFGRHAGLFTNEVIAAADHQLDALYDAAFDNLQSAGLVKL